MSRARFFLHGPLGEGPLALSGEDLHHLRDVRRLGPGDEIVVVEPSGAEKVVRLGAVDSSGARGTMIERIEKRTGPRVVLLQALMKGKKMDLVVEKATELGVEAVVPMVTDRVVANLQPERVDARLARWERIAAEAAKQSQRRFVPRIERPVRLDELPEAAEDVGALVVAWQDAHSKGVGEALSRLRPVDGAVGVVVGPEGGLTPEEADLLVSRGAETARLGANVLRTETAGVVAVALVLYELGGLGGAYE